MSRSFRIAIFFAVPVAVGVVAGGCNPVAKPPAVQPAADHDHPATLAEGVAALRKFAADLGAKLASGSHEAADDAVHGLGHMLEDLPALAAKAKLSEQAAEGAKIAIGELEECFGKLDEALHAAEGQGDSPAEVHASLKDRIEAALKSLEETKE